MRTSSIRGSFIGTTVVYLLIVVVQLLIAQSFDPMVIGPATILALIVAAYQWFSNYAGRKLREYQLKQLKKELG